MFIQRIRTIALGCIAIAITAPGAERPDSGRPEARSDWTVKIGVMGFAQTELLHTEDGATDFSGIPIAMLEYKDFYWKGTEAGYKYPSDSGWTVTPFIKLRSGIGLTGAPGGFSSNAIEADDMANGYRGIDDRDQQLEAGIKLELELADQYTMELEARLGERGSSAEALLKRNFQGENFKWMLSPFVAVRMLDSSFVDYYFSVSEREAADARSYKINSDYDPDTIGWAGSIGLSGLYRLDAHWALISSVKGQTLSSEIADSPLVRQRENLSVTFGAAYQF